VWSGGVRTGSFRASLPVIKSVDTRSDLDAYVDHTFVTTGGATLSRNVVSATTSNSPGVDTYSASFAYEATAKLPPLGIDTTAVAAVATPTLRVAPGRYEIDVPEVGKMTFDLYPEGAMKVSLPGGATKQASLYCSTYAWYLAQFPLFGTLSASYDANTNTMTISVSGRPSVFEGPLTGAMRKG
jgi:hypothetical protein